MFEHHCPENCECKAVEVWRRWTNAMFYAQFEFKQIISAVEVKVGVEVTDHVYFF